MSDIATFQDGSAAGWAERINACWRQSLDGIFATGRLLAEAKEVLPHGEFRAMCAERLPFKPRMVQMLMAIAKDQRLSNAQYVAHLPPSWGTLYDLTRLDDATLDARVRDGTINPAMERKAISTAVKQVARNTREVTLGLSQRELPDVKAGLILEDYEWDDEVWSRETGMDRHASNHYPTSSDAHTAEEIHRRRPIESIIDKRGCVHAMWTTNQHLWIAMHLMALRGFAYKSNYVWGKDKISTGRWNRSKHEILLLGTIGNPPCPAPGTQWDSLQCAPKGEHSAKPDCFYEMLEAYFPTLVKVELNARRPRPGWAQWGNEAPVESCDPSTGEITEPESDAEKPGFHVGQEPAVVKEVGSSAAAGSTVTESGFIPAFLRRPAA